MQASGPSSTRLLNAERIRVIGQGLAGSMLALMLKDRGIPFVVQDTHLPGAATEVAPGIVNPLAGRNFRPPERISMLLEETRAGMALVEKYLGVDIWTPCPILRMFSEPTQIDRFDRVRDNPEADRFVEERYGENAFDYLNDVFGSFRTGGGGWANLPLLKEKMRDWLRRENCLVEEEWTPASTTDKREILCFCEGWQVASREEWSFIPHNPAKGEMLIVRFEEDLPRDRIYNQTCWVQPIEDGLWRVGATYTWSNFNNEPSLEGASDLQDRLHLLTPVPFHVVDQIGGVRPIVEDYHPVLGKHPSKENWYILNAMGSKGVLQAPAAAKSLIDYILDHKGILPDWSVARFA